MQIPIFIFLVVCFFAGIGIAYCIDRATRKGKIIIGGDKIEIKYNKSSMIEGKDYTFDKKTGTIIINS